MYPIGEAIGRRQDKVELALREASGPRPKNAPQKSSPAGSCLGILLPLPSVSIPQDRTSAARALEDFNSEDLSAWTVKSPQPWIRAIVSQPKWAKGLALRR